MLVVLAAALGSACSDVPDREGEVVGIVTEVTGDVNGVESFVVLTPDGDSFKFKPRAGLLVMGAPPFQLRERVVSGDAVKVVYHREPAGDLIADEVVDGSS